MADSKGLNLQAPDPLGLHPTVGETLAHMAEPSSQGGEVDEKVRASRARQRYDALVVEHTAYVADRSAAVAAALAPLKETK